MVPSMMPAESMSAPVMVLLPRKITHQSMNKVAAAMKSITSTSNKAKGLNTTDEITSSGTIFDQRKFTSDSHVQSTQALKEMKACTSCSLQFSRASFLPTSEGGLTSPELANNSIELFPINVLFPLDACNDPSRGDTKV